jgi:hypothetical protein
MKNALFASVMLLALVAVASAQIVPPYTEIPSVMLTFVLLNDSETPVDVEAGSWGIVIDGAELKTRGCCLVTA